MGRKVHPIGFRLKINKTWEGRWYAEGEDYVNQLHQDFALRELGPRRSRQSRRLSDRDRALPWQGEGYRSHRQTRHPDRPQRRECEEDPPEPGSCGRARRSIWRSKRSNPRIWMLILVAQNIADQLERRISYQRAMKRAIQQAIRQGGQGIRSKSPGA